MNNLVNRVKYLYEREELSGVEIADKLKLNRRYIYRVMEKGGIKRRKASESNSIKFLKAKPTFKIKGKLTNFDEELLACGVMIYWAEGWKDKRKQMLDFANSDPTMIRMYLKFLRDICGVNKDKLRVYLYCYANQNVVQIKKFWSKITGIPLLQFTKPYVRNDFREDKIGKMPYGLIHVRYADKKLYGQILIWHEKLIKKWGCGGVVNHSRL